MSSPIRVLLLVLSISICLSLPAQQATEPPATPPDFSEVQKAIAGLRNGNESELSLKVAEKTFSVRQSVGTSIEKAQADQLLASSEEKRGLPQFRIAKGKMFVIYTINDDISIEKALASKDNSPAQWTQKTLTPIATYPIEQWPAFAQFVITNGLAHYASYESEDAAGGVLLFSATGPSSVVNGSKSLRIPPGFYEVMRFSPQHKSAPGDAGFVIIIHDPHSDVPGRYALIRGLSVLLNANPETQFSFLNEGRFPEKPDVDYTKLPNRRIAEPGLSRHLATSPGVRRAAIYRMTGNYLIDAVYAYRLLHPEQHISAFKIDDNRFLKETRMQEVTEKQENDAFATVSKAIQERLSAKAASPASGSASSPEESLLQQLLITRALEWADKSEMSDEELPSYNVAMAKYFGGLAEDVRKFAANHTDLRAAAHTFELKSDEYANETLVFVNALKRNKTMAQFMAEAAMNPRLYGTSLAFIGSYHTGGITAELRKKNIGYIVIEPKKTTLFTDRKQEEQDFNRFLKNPDSYFASVKANKGLAELTPFQVEHYHAPFVRDTNVHMEKQRTSIASIGKTLPPEVDTARLAESILSNPYSDRLTVSSAGDGGGAKPPDLPKGAFAYFESSDDRPHLTFVGQSGEEWKGNARYAFMQEVALGIPKEEASDKVKLTMISLYSQDPVTGRGCSTLYDGASRRLYLIEADAMDVAKLLVPPARKKGKNAEFSLQLAELEKERKRNANGERSGEAGQQNTDN